jgi:hypothetical protein
MDNHKIENFDFFDSDSALYYIDSMIKFRTFFRENSSAELSRRLGVSQNVINIMKNRFNKGEMTPKTAKRWVDKLLK